MTRRPTRRVVSDGKAAFGTPNDLHLQTAEQVIACFKRRGLGPPPGFDAPKCAHPLVEENYLRWDSLGEFLALAASFEHFAVVNNNDKARVLGETLDKATGTFLLENKSPGRKLGTIDNRGSHFYLAMFWAEELAKQDADLDLAASFAELAATLRSNEAKIVEELIAVQGSAVEIGGYFRPDEAKRYAVMRPSATLNAAIDAL